VGVCMCVCVWCDARATKSSQPPPNRPLAPHLIRFGVVASLADAVQAPPLVMQVLTSGPSALASSFLVREDAALDELFRWDGVGWGGANW
jgi:hypothetical protein